jgi:hypothetical protein
MNEEIIVAVYDTEAHADAAVRDLEAAHVPPTAITRHAGGPAASGTPGSSGNPAGQGFWSSLFGGEPDHDTSVYDRSLESGSSVVTVRVPDEHVDRVTQILERHHPIDIDERAASFGLGANRSATAPDVLEAAAALASAASLAVCTVLSRVCFSFASASSNSCSIPNW